MFEKILREGAIINLLWKVLEVNGNDSETFIQNQTTNDLTNLDELEFQWNTLLDISGKIVSYFILLKQNKDKFYLIVPNELVEVTKERLEKYLISEDAQIIDTNLKCHVAIGAMANSIKGYSGHFLNLVSTITFENVAPINEIEANHFWFVQGDPMGKTEQIIGTLANNTYLEELALNYKKGCFLGQETVSKIHTRRGAAFKFVILEFNEKIPNEIFDIIVDGNKIAKVFESKTINNRFFARAMINRDNRLDNKKIKFQIDNTHFEATVNYAPLIKKDLIEISQDLYDEAIIAFQQDHEALAIELLSKAIELNPSFEDAYESLGVIYGRLEQFEKAISLMQKLSEINTSSVMAHTNMSLYYMRVGEIDKAEEHKSIATIKSFEYFGKEAENKRIEQEILKKKQDELLQREKMFRQVLEIDNDDPLANFGLGDIELNRNNFFESIKYLQKAITIDSKYSVAYLALGKALMNSKQTEKAKEVLANGIKIATQNGDMMPANEMQKLLTDLN